MKKIKHKTNHHLDDDVVLRVEHLSKKFCRTLKRSMYYGTIDIARSMMGINYDTGKLRKDEFWALDDVNFELKKGETLGIIGENGSGKSTLLRLITGIFPPDKGKITFKGRIGALIAVGAGFHPHMSGRENVYLNGTILGMTRKELDERLDEILEFADIGEFIDAPVNTYSSGMRVRLGFAIAVHCEPDILLVDEVLSVGDLAFRNKSMRKMAEFREKANALIFISHNLEQVRVLCEKLIVLNEGKIIYSGPTHQGIVRYEEMSRDKRILNLKKEKIKSGLALKGYEHDENDIIEVLDVGICTDDYSKVDYIDMNSQLTLFCCFAINILVEELYFSVGVLNEQFQPCIWLVSNDHKKETFENFSKGTYKLLVKIPNHHLVPGLYIPNISIRNGKTGETYERVLPEYSFKIKSDGNFLERGVVSVEEKWEVLKINENFR